MVLFIQKPGNSPEKHSMGRIRNKTKPIGFKCFGEVLGLTGGRFRNQTALRLARIVI